MITHLVITIPIIVWIMIGYFENMPAELEDAALVDGATPWQSFRYIAFRLASPASWWRHPGLHLLVEQLHLLGGAGRQETRTLPVAVYNVLTFEQSPGAARRGGAARDVAGAAAHRHRAAPDRGWPHRGGRQGRVAKRVRTLTRWLTLPLGEIALPAAARGSGDRGRAAGGRAWPSPPAPRWRRPPLRASRPATTGP